MFVVRRFGFSLEDEAAVVFCGSKKSLASGLPMAKVLMQELAPYKLMFIEEPVLSEHREALARAAVCNGGVEHRERRQYLATEVGRTVHRRRRPRGPLLVGALPPKISRRRLGPS